MTTPLEDFLNGFAGHAGQDADPKLPPIVQEIKDLNDRLQRIGK